MTLINLGILGKPFGLKGEIYFYPINVSTKSLFQNQNIIIQKTDQSKVSCVVENIRKHKDCLVLKLSGHHSKEEAAMLTHCQILIDREELPSLPENEFYLNDVIGFEVYAEDGKLVGLVDHFSVNQADQSIMHVKSQGQILDLLMKPFVKDVDLQTRRCYIILPDYEE